MKRFMWSRVVMTILCTTIVFGLCGGAPGQSPGGVSNDPKGPFSASLERRESEEALRTLPNRMKEKRSLAFSNPQILKQMNEDFIRIQAIRRGMVQQITTAQPFILRPLEDETDEIRKRAIRLRNSLVLTDASAEKLASGIKNFTRESIADAVFDLCLEISRFTENPIFKANRVYTVRDAKEASLALDRLILLAGQIGKEAERLRRSN